MTNNNPGQNFSNSAQLILKMSSILTKSRIILSHSRKLKHFYVLRSMSSETSIKTAVATPDNHYDIIIVGGGMVGTTLSCALGQLNNIL